MEDSTLHPFFDDQPRWYRIAFKTVTTDGQPVRSRFVGHFTRDSDGKIRGQRKDSTDAAPNDLTLNVFLGAVEDIVKVEARHPRYDVWVSLPWPADVWSWDDPRVQALTP